MARVRRPESQGKAPPPSLLFFRAPFTSHRSPLSERLEQARVKLACVAHTLSRAPKFPLPLPLSTPATQAKVKQAQVFYRSSNRLSLEIKSLFISHFSPTVNQLSINNHLRKRLCYITISHMPRQRASSLSRQRIKQRIKS